MNHFRLTDLLTIDPSAGVWVGIGVCVLLVGGLIFLFVALLKADTLEISRQGIKFKRYVRRGPQRTAPVVPNQQLKPKPNP
jgi:hypothetical protein